MAGFSDIIGHEQIKTYFQKAAAKGNYSHAYILSGDDGMGKMMLAKTFAQAILCETHTACGKCPYCKQVLTGNHPDLFVIRRPEDKKIISVDQIREQIVDTTGILPYESDRKIYIIDEAELMNEQAQNALLKTIEEPPAYVIMILLAARPEALLQTIHSRCTKMSLHPVSDAEVSQYLEKNYQVSPEDAAVYAAFARGNIGKAAALSGSDEFMELYHTVLELLTNIFDRPLYELQATMKSLKERAADVFHIMRLWYRDVTVYKSCGQPDRLVFPGQVQAIDRISRAQSFEILDKIQTAIDTAEMRLASNVSFDLASQVLLIAMRERN